MSASQYSDIKGVVEGMGYDIFHPDHTPDPKQRDASWQGAITLSRDKFMDQGKPLFYPVYDHDSNQVAVMQLFRTTVNGETKDAVIAYRGTVDNGHITIPPGEEGRAGVYVDGGQKLDSQQADSLYTEGRAFVDETIERWDKENGISPPPPPKGVRSRT